MAIEGRTNCEGPRRRRPGVPQVNATLVPLDRLGTLDGNKRPLRDWPFKCTGCGSREVALWLFARRAEADAWLEN
jgi:hypothetical protein